jgi:hypothetical protein
MTAAAKMRRRWARSDWAQDREASCTGFPALQQRRVYLFDQTRDSARAVLMTGRRGDEGKGVRLLEGRPA